MSAFKLIKKKPALRNFLKKCKLKFKKKKNLKSNLN